MAVPTVSSIVPATGHTGGQTLVQITGTNFALPPVAVPTGEGPLPDPAASLLVLIGGTPATHVAVVDSTTIFCLTPAHDETGRGDVAASDVAVQNLDEDGEVIVGELATLAAAFSFLRPDFAGTGRLARAVAALVLMLRQKVLPNVSTAAHTDYDEATGDGLHIAFAASLPALLLVRPVLRDSEEIVNPGQPVTAVSDTRFVTTTKTTVKDILFTLIGVADDALLLLDIYETLTDVFANTPHLFVVDNFSGETFQYALVLDPRQENEITVQGKNVQSFAMNVGILGICLQGIPGAPKVSVPGVPDTVQGDTVREYGYLGETVSIATHKFPFP